MDMNFLYIPLTLQLNRRDIFLNLRPAKAW